jgi:CheY-like chemotaxis protein
LAEIPFNILAVDDEPIVLELYRDILESTHLRLGSDLAPASADDRAAPVSG